MNEKIIGIRTDCKKLFDNAVKGGVAYLARYPKIETLVIGISGGIDSAVTAAIAREACDMAGRKLLGYRLPGIGNKANECERAWEVCREFCHQHGEYVINGMYDSILSTVDYSLALKPLDGEPFTHAEKIRCGNIKARVRMSCLYDLAAKHCGLVLSTDNLTEYNLGFWTLHGDVGDFGFIQNLWKTEVYGIGELVGGSVAGCVDAVPTDGLGITNSDIDQLLPNWTPEDGSYRDAYRVIDDILIEHLRGLGTHSPDHPVIRRYEETHFKRQNPISLNRLVLIL